MNIAHANTVYYLLERGLITFESAVDGDLMLVASSSNNTNTKVIRRNEAGLFIKQISRSDMTAVVSVQREAMCYWLGHNDRDFEALTPFIPKYHDYDPARHMLVTELLPDGDNLYQYRYNQGKYPPGSPARIGRAVAVYTSRCGSEMRKGEQASTMAKQMPWVLAIHQPESPMLPTFGHASNGLLAYLKTDPLFYPLLDALQKLWRYDAFIHGDIKWDNFIVYDRNETGDEYTLKLIDWELAGFGDAAWDLGSAFQAYLSFPIISLSSIPGQLPTNLAGLLQFAPQEIRQAVRELWIGYLGEQPLDERAAAEFIERVMRSAGARLLQTALECTETMKLHQQQQHQYYTDMLTAKAYCLGAVALDILKNPAQSLSLVFNA
jgi:Phosphotransferase enzyme family